MRPNYQNTSMLDMVFENRNKSYGAYELRNDYSNRMARAVLLTLTALALLSFGKIAADKLSKTKTAGGIISCELNLKDIVIDKPVVKIEPPKPPVQPEQAKAINSVRDVEMRVTASSNLVDSMLTNEEKNDFEAGIQSNPNGNREGVTDGKGTMSTFSVAVAAPPVEPEVRIFSEVMPEFPGGDKALMSFLSRYTEYPEYERDIDMQGKAVVKFVVNEDGSISNVSVVKKDSPGFAKEAMRVVAMMPKFKPGLQQGKPVKVQYVLPFQFKLDNR